MESVALDGPELPAWVKFLDFPFLSDDSLLIRFDLVYVRSFKTESLARS